MFRRDEEHGEMMIKATRLLLLGGLILANRTARAAFDDEKTAAAEKALKDKGLTKDDRHYLLDESAAVEKLTQAKTAQADYQKAFSRYAPIVEYDQAVQAMEMERQLLQQEVSMLQSQINSSNAGGRMRRMVNTQVAPLIQQQSQDRARINQINTQLQASKAQAPKAEDRKTLPGEVERTRQAFLDSVRELNDVVAPLLTKYHELALDKTVTDSLAQLRHSTTLNYKLGPSDAVHEASKLIQDVRKLTTGTSKPAAKKKAKAKGS
jgi:hypothetical protein